MFADPQTVTYATVAKALPAISRDATASTYKLFDTGSVAYQLVLSHAFGKRNRAVARLTRESMTADPLVPANQIAVGITATLTMDYPAVLAPADAQALAKALVAYLTDANLLKLASGET